LKHQTANCAVAQRVQGCNRKPKGFVEDGANGILDHAAVRDGAAAAVFDDHLSGFS
jgi:hypothetical protein